MSAVGIGSDPARARIGIALVELVGSRGLAAVEVESVCAAARCGRSTFDRCFADLEECFVSVHDEISALLCARVEAAREARGGWHDRIWAAGLAAMSFLREDPERARFLVSSVNGAGRLAQSRRDRIVSAIADVLDDRREADGRAAISRCTAEIAAGAVYGMLLAKVDRGAIDRGEDFLPELVYLGVMPYVGPDAAEGELAVQPLFATEG